MRSVELIHCVIEFYLPLTSVFIPVACKGEGVNGAMAPGIQGRGASKE